MSKIVDYYRGQAVDSEGRTLEQAWAMYDDWENCHDFIQWLFPLKDESFFNINAPLLTDEDIKIFSNDNRCMVNLLHSTNLMLGFFGMDLQAGIDSHVCLDEKIVIEFDNTDIPVETKVPVFNPVILSKFKSRQLGTVFIDTITGYETVFLCRRDRIFGSFNHNHLRMTRMLLCLTLIGFNDLTKTIYDFLEKNDAGKIPVNCWEHWKMALQGKSLPKPKMPKTFYHNNTDKEMEDFFFST